ncbi:amidohydrolase family protein [Pseudonocardia benzenivorans]
MAQPPRRERRRLGEGHGRGPVHPPVGLPLHQRGRRLPRGRGPPGHAARDRPRLHRAPPARPARHLPRRAARRAVPRHRRDARRDGRGDDRVRLQRVDVRALAAERRPLARRTRHRPAGPGGGGRRDRPGGTARRDRRRLHAARRDPDGEKHYWPIYEACSRHELPLIVHPSGCENVFAKAPKMAGTPTFYLEWHTALGQIHQSNTLSMICHGVFEKFPKLKYIIAEGGFLWALEVMWKLDRDWKGLRNEVPWLVKPRRSTCSSTSASRRSRSSSRTTRSTSRR